MAQLLSVNVGLPREIEWKGKTVHTAVWKHPLRGRRQVGKLNIAGDGQGDLQGHGGEQRAVLVYQVASYRYWEKQLGRKDFVFGQFGENFTIDGLSDDEVCIGDRHRIGSALFEVTQPRVTRVKKKGSMYVIQENSRRHPRLCHAYRQSDLRAAVHDAESPGYCS